MSLSRKERIILGLLAEHGELGGMYVVRVGHVKVFRVTEGGRRALAGTQDLCQAFRDPRIAWSDDFKAKHSAILERPAARARQASGGPDE